MIFGCANYALITICMHALNYAALNNVSIVTKDLVAEAANNEVVDVILRSAQ